MPFRITNHHDMKTRRLVIIALALLIIMPLSSLKAQIIKGEVFLGGNACQVDGDECYGYKRFGLHAGAGALVPVTSFMDVGLEVLFNQKGAFKRDSIQYGSSFTHSYDLRLNYAEIPVMVYFTDKNKYSIGLGLSYGRIVGISEKIDHHSTDIGIGDGHLRWKEGYNGPDLGNIKNLEQLGEVVYHQQGIPDSIPISQYVSNSNSYTPSDLCVCACMRFRFWKGFHAELRYQYSLKSIRTRIHYDEFPEINPHHISLQHNNVLTLRIAYIFNEPDRKSTDKKTKTNSIY